MNDWQKEANERDDLLEVLKEKCPLCETGTLTEQSHKVSVDYYGHTTELDCFDSVCDHCGSEIASAEQVNRNAKSMKEFKKKCYIDAVNSNLVNTLLEFVKGVPSTEEGTILLPKHFLLANLRAIIYDQCKKEVDSATLP